MTEKHVLIDTSVVRRLIDSQFPQWRELPIDPVATSGWDNRTFHLGNNKLVRLPSAAEYELQVEKEHQWLPRLAPQLPLPIPTPIAMGHPEHGYLWKWSIYRWLDGETVASTNIVDLTGLALDLANFLTTLHKIDATDGPPAGLHSFYRGGSLSVYDNETRRFIASLKDQIDTVAITEVWETALVTSWKKPPIWVHGDISAGNLLVHNGRLSAVIDFGQLSVGDPACDLAVCWTLFHGESREAFKKRLLLDKETWARARGWTLWKALMVASGFTNPNNYESSKCWQIIDEVLADHKCEV